MLHSLYLSSLKLISRVTSRAQQENLSNFSIFLLLFFHTVHTYLPFSPIFVFSEPRFQTFRKIWLDSVYAALFTAWAFGLKLHLILHRGEFIRPVYYCKWRIFMVGIGAFRVLMRTALSLIFH